MTRSAWLARARSAVAGEWHHLTRVNSSARRWPMPLAAALSSGLPLLVGAATGHVAAGLAGSLGGLVFLYLPETPLRDRMVVLMACAFGLTSCYAAGLAVHALGADWLRAPLVACVALLVTITVRAYQLAPPGPLFFVMVAAIGAYTPMPLAKLPLQVGLLFLGALGAALIAFAYSLATTARLAVPPAAARSATAFDDNVIDAILIALGVGASLFAAELLGLPRPYWVAVSCMAVLQGATLRAVWNRQLHRIVGTAAGMAVAAVLLALRLDGWGLAVAIMVLTWLVEWLVVRHYGLAVVFITPLTILLAEAGTLRAAHEIDNLVVARLGDTALGCVVGFATGLILHSPRCRSGIAMVLRTFFPAGR